MLRSICAIPACRFSRIQFNERKRMYKYSLKNPQGEYDSVIRLADNKVIKLNESDLLYKAVKLWMSRGNDPAPPDQENNSIAESVVAAEENLVETVKEEPSEAENASEDAVQPADDPNPRSKRKSLGKRF
jgi:hypothetical protein